MSRKCAPAKLRIASLATAGVNIKGAIVNSVVHYGKPTLYHCHSKLVGFGSDRALEMAGKYANLGKLLEKKFLNSSLSTVMLTSS